MKHNVWFDSESNSAWMELIGDVSPEEMSTMLKQCADLLEGKTPRFLVTDHTQSPKGVSKRVRKVLQEEAPAVNADKHAFIGTKPSNRILAKIIIAVIGKSKTTKFLKSKADAIAWLREDA